MIDLITALPEQLKAGIALGTAGRISVPYRSIICCGMGGSAIAGEMLSLVHGAVVVHWDYDLPEQTGANDLVICTSWSGDTQETLSSYEAAISLGAHTLVITAGGKLGALAKANGTPLITLPHTNAFPRTNVGLMAGALFGALGLERHLPSSLDAHAPQAQAQRLVECIGNRTLVLYSSYPWRKLTGFWKMAYSETAKRQVMANWFPSGAHNEVVGWEGPYQKSHAIVLLRDSDELPRYAQNFDALLAILEKRGYTVTTVPLFGNTLLEKVCNSYLLALWTSALQAQQLGIDPLVTQLLDDFKRLKE